MPFSINDQVARNRARIGGAGFTLFFFGGQPITFCDTVQHNSPRPVAPPTYLQPLDEPYPVEILIPPAAQGGQLVLNMIELFGSNGHVSKVWDRLGANIHGNTSTPFGGLTGDLGQSQGSQFLQLVGKNNPGSGVFAGAVDIVDLFIRQALTTPDKLRISQVIRPLSANGAQSALYTVDYIGCVIVDVVDGEQIAVGSKEIIKQITVAYRYSLRNGQVSQAFRLRDGAAPRITGAGQTGGQSVF